MCRPAKSLLALPHLDGVAMSPAITREGSPTVRAKAEIVKQMDFEV
jgi:hypothetical protein